MRTGIIGLIIAAIAALHARSADACTMHGSIDVVTYWDGSSTYRPASANDNRCTQNKDGTQDCKLQGFYMVPNGAPSGALPTVVFIHGSGTANPSGYCETMNAFLDRGYIVFAPVMRGVTGTVYKPDSAYPYYKAVTFPHPFETNTGAYIETWAADKAASSSTCALVCQTLDYMNKETKDIDSAIHWLVTNRPTRTDLSRLALVGHSYGGATVTIAQASTSYLTYVPTVTVSLDGAAMSWSPGSDWEDTLNLAADHWRSPLYFQRVINESPLAPDIGSALEPYDHAVWAGDAARLASYGWYQPISTTLCNDFAYHNVHCGFVVEPEGVAIWIDGVIEFLRDYGVK